MSTLYLIDAHSTIVNDSRILDVVTGHKYNGLITDVNMTGSFPVLIPDGVSVPNGVSNVSDLITAKIDGLMAMYPDFGNCVYEDFLASPNYDLTSCMNVSVASRFGALTSSYANTKRFTTDTIVLTGTPSRIMVFLDVYLHGELTEVGRMIHRFSESEPDPDIFATFDGSDPWAIPNPFSHGSLVNIPLADQGDQLRLSVELSPNQCLGGWTLLYNVI